MNYSSQNSGEKDRRNFAPVKPFLDLKDQTRHDIDAQKSAVENDLVKQFREKYNELKDRDQQAWRSIILAGQINAMFLSGEQIVKINQYNGQPRVEAPNVKDPMQIRAINKLQQYATQMQAKWKSSKPDIVVVARSDADEAIAQAKKANLVCDQLERDFFTNWFDLQEGLDAQIWGWYGRQVVTDYSDKHFTAIKSLWGEKEIAIGSDIAECAACGFRADDYQASPDADSQFPACPACGSLEFEIEPAARQIIPVVTGHEKIVLPSVRVRSIKLPATRWDIGKRIEDSAWCLIERYVDEGELRQMLGALRIPESVSDSADDLGLDVLDFISRRGSSIVGEYRVAKEQRKKVKLTEMYLSASDLWDIRIPKGVKTVDGDELPADKRASEVWPDGVTILGVQGCALIPSITHGTHKNLVSAGVYHMKPDSGTGRGIDDSIEIQKTFNRMFSQISANMQSRGTPALLVAENAIEERYRRLLGVPNAVIPIKLDNFPDVKDIRQLYTRLEGQSVPGDMLNVTFSALENLLQMSYHIMNFAGGNPRVSNKTATGAEILDSNADEIVTPILSIKAECNLNTIRNGFYLWATCTPEPRFIRFEPDNPQNTRGLNITGDEVNAQYDWSYTPGTEAPKTRFTENQKRVNFFALFGGVNNYLMARQQFPAEVAKIEREFDVRLETEVTDAVATSCRIRLTAARELLTAMAAMSEAMEAATGMQMPVDYAAIMAEVQPVMLPTEDRLQDKAVWFQKLLDSEEGLQMPASERQLVSAFVEAFQELAKVQAAKIQTDAAEVQMAAQAPAMEAQAQQQQAAQAAQIEQQAAERDQQIELEREKQLAADEQEARKLEADDRRMAAEHAMRLAEMQFEREKQAESEADYVI